MNVTLDNVTINVDEGYKYGYEPNAYKTAVSVTGSGNTNIELNGNNTLTSGYGHAGLEHNKTDGSGTLTIQDEKNDDGSAKGSASDTTGSLTATGGYHSAGIGGSDKQDGQVTITGGEITATGGNGAAGIGGGAGDKYAAVGGDGDVTISGGTITATGAVWVPVLAAVPTAMVLSQLPTAISPQRLRAIMVPVLVAVLARYRRTLLLEEMALSPSAAAPSPKPLVAIWLLASVAAIRVWVQ